MSSMSPNEQKISILGLQGPSIPVFVGCFDREPKGFEKVYKITVMFVLMFSAVVWNLIYVI